MPISISDRKLASLYKSLETQRATNPNGSLRIPQVMEMQLRSPVRWASCVASLVDAGCDTFIEIGPKRALTGMMRELAPGRTSSAAGTPKAVEELALDH